jgi:hypothetical protein
MLESSWKCANGLITKHGWSFYMIVKFYTLRFYKVKKNYLKKNKEKSLTMVVGLR